MRYVLFVVALVCASVSVSCSNHLLPQIYSLHVTSKIQFRYARTLVTSRVANPARIPQEVTFSMVIPDTAFISGFLIEDDDHVYKAYIREKEAAKREYTEAVKQGRVAGYVGLNVRDSNLFTVSVNLGPRKKISFNLTYEELLVRTLGVYKHVINLDPGNVVQEFNVEVHIDESSDITALEVPALTIENEINLYPTKDYDFNPIATIEHTSPRSAVVRWSPTPEEQLELASYGVRGQLIVRYDVDRKSHPHQILVNEGYFVHFFAPTDLPTLQKQVTFVLDVSASMEGRKLHQLKEAMHAILSELRSTDFFSLIAFSSRTSVWNASNYKTWMTKMRKKYFNSAVVPATDENKRNAKLAIDNLEADGATNINKALKTAMHIARLGKKLLQLWTSDDLDEPMHPEPMIIFLTDGSPTEGKIKPEKIVTSTSKWNRRCRASIFTLALGNDADFPFLKKLALLNSGFARKIYEASHTTLQLVDFYRQIASPLLANVTFNYQAQQVEYPSLTKHRFSSFYSGSELVVAGHLHASSTSSKLRYEVNARSPEGLTKFQPLEPPLIIIEHPPIDGDYTDHNSSIMERLWAYLSIQQMLDRADSKTNRMFFLSKQALQLALKYSFVTPVTSLLVVKPNGTTDFAVLKSVVKTQPAPANMDIDKDIARRTGWSQIGRNDLVRIAPESNIGIEEENSGTLDMSPPTEWIQRWYKKSATTSTDSELEATTIVDFSDIDWLIAFTVGSRIFLPFGSNSTVEVVGPGDPLFLLSQDGGQCTTPERERGRCRHLRVCPLNTFAQNFTVYQQYFCTIGYSTGTKYAGACCPYRLSSQYA